MGPIYWHALTSMAVWISNYIYHTICNVGKYYFTVLNSTVEVWGWVNHFMISFWSCDYLFMRRLKLNNVSKSGICCLFGVAVVSSIMILPWASYQIRKIAGCECAGNAGNDFSTTDFKGNPKLAIPAWHVSRHVRGARAVMHVGIANSRWRGKRFRHSRRINNSQIYVSGKKPISAMHYCISTLTMSYLITMVPREHHGFSYYCDSTVD